MVFKDVLYFTVLPLVESVSCDLMVFKDVLYCTAAEASSFPCCDLMVFKDVLYFCRGFEGIGEGL